MMPIMKHLPALICLLLVPASLRAQRLDWKPSDFAPLMEVPWEKDNAPMKDVLQAVFREPDREIRDLVLEAYLDEIPIDRFDDAFKTCLAFEGSQCPEEVVNLVLRSWGSRDAAKAWEKGKSLFKVIVPGGDVLSLDSWSRPRLDAVNLDSLRKSNIWLTYIDGLGEGLEEADVPQPLKNGLLKEFANLTIDHLGRLPHPNWDAISPARSHQHTQMIKALRLQPEEGRELVRDGKGRGYGPAEIKIGLIKWLTAKPQDALKILEAAKGIKYDAVGDQPARDLSMPTTSFLIQWAKLDLPGMVRWAEPQEIAKYPSEAGYEARGLLMSRVDEATRMRWLRKAKETKDSDDQLAALFEAWSGWDPERAIKAAFETRNGYIIEEATDGAVYGLLGTSNGCHHGMGVLFNYDLEAMAAKLTPEQREEAFNTFGIRIMERWIGVDVGEAAQFGFHFLMMPSLAKWFPRDELTKLFSGDDAFSSDASMIDRTFCALRFWAFWKPDEMRRWIATVDDAEMRKALTWLLEHPMHEIPAKKANAAGKP
jgi:hypothetical protein